MKRITIKAYAVKHKLSMFNVIKMVKSGALKSEVVPENGRDVTYILYEDESDNTVVEKSTPPAEKEVPRTAEMSDELKALKEEVQLLRHEVEALKRELTMWPK